MTRKSLALTAILVLSGTAFAQLPPEAVLLDKLKIPEQQKSEELCPVHLDETDPEILTWKHEGVTYGGSTAECQAEFLKDPGKHATAALKQRWENNFIAAMSTIWCPVMDVVNPGGGKIWEALDLTWESCCQFCNESVVDEDFTRGLEVLKGRAAESFELTKGKYVEGASSPIEGAIDLDAG